VREDRGKRGRGAGAAWDGVKRRRRSQTSALVTGKKKEFKEARHIRRGNVESMERRKGLLD